MVRLSRSALPTYKLRFHELALAEWNKLDKTIREPFLKKLAERLLQPRVQAAALSGMPDCYKIKIQSVGYRLVYRVDEDVIYVTVVAVGKRERSAVYKRAIKRL